MSDSDRHQIRLDNLVARITHYVKLGMKTPQISSSIMHRLSTAFKKGEHNIDVASIIGWLPMTLGRLRYYMHRGHICSWCQGVLSGLEILGDDQISHERGSGFNLKLASIRAHARQRCYICSVIWKNVENSLVIPPWLVKDSDVKIMYQLQADPTQRSQSLELDIAFTIGIPSTSRWLEVDESFVLYAKSVDSQKLGKISSKSTKSYESFRTAKGWISNCKNHQRCCRALEPVDAHPTRLIDISRAEKVLLCEFPNYDPGARYATLSYCWGKRSFKYLTEASYREFEAGVPVHILPKTFQDAITFARHLGLRYIWIDSLCIIQDNPDDWQKESASMQDIYAHSYITIAATHCHDSDQGLYSKRCPELSNPPTINLRHKNISSQKYILIDQATWDSEIQESPLNSRGWALQERLLSTRVLHFSHKQLGWECLEKDAMEALPHGIPLGQDHDGTFRLKNFFPEANLKLGINSVLKDRYEKQWWPYIIWCRVVENYSKRQLSYTSDKLIAISGIAKMFSRLFSCDYVAGLWTESIERQLLWHLNDIPTVKPEYRAPSWSWASVDGQVCQPLCWDKALILAEMVSVDVKNATSNKYGLVREGELVMRGEIKEIFLSPLGCRPDLSSRYMMKAVYKMGTTRKLRNSFLHPDPEVQLDHIIPEPCQCQLYCVPVYYNRPDQELRGLILCLGKAKDKYQRVGTFWSWSAENIEAILEVTSTEESKQQIVIV